MVKIISIKTDETVTSRDVHLLTSSVEQFFLRS